MKELPTEIIEKAKSIIPQYRTEAFSLHRLVHNSIVLNKIRNTQRIIQLLFVEKKLDLEEVKIFYLFLEEYFSSSRQIFFNKGPIENRIAARAKEMKKKLGKTFAGTNHNYFVKRFKPLLQAELIIQADIKNELLLRPELKIDGYKKGKLSYQPNPNLFEVKDDPYQHRSSMHIVRDELGYFLKVLTDEDYAKRDKFYELSDKFAFDKLVKTGLKKGEMEQLRSMAFTALDRINIYGHDLIFLFLEGKDVKGMIRGKTK
ncbi:hypothetical protein ACFL1B_05450 [Nanoarchaeota archaeon]